jgi:hypothetical protein
LSSHGKDITLNVGFKLKIDEKIMNYLPNGVPMDKVKIIKGKGVL